LKNEGASADLQSANDFKIERVQRGVLHYWLDTQKKTLE